MIDASHEGGIATTQHKNSAEFRCNLFQQKYQSVDSKYLMEHLDFFSTIDNKGNYCYLLSLYYLFSHQDSIRNHWEQIISSDSSLETVHGFPLLFSFCKSFLPPEDFNQDISKWVLTSNSPIGKKQHDITDFLVHHFNHETSYDLKSFFLFQKPNSKLIEDDFMIHVNHEQSIQESLNTIFTDLFLTLFPELLLITIDRSQIKNHKQIISNDQVEIPQYVKIKETNYAFCGAVIYTGNGKSGHYRTVSKIADVLVEYNDRHMHPFLSYLTTNQLMSNSVLLLYEKADIGSFCGDNIVTIHSESITQPYHSYLQNQYEDEIMAMQNKIQKEGWTSPQADKVIKKYFALSNPSKAFNVFDKVDDDSSDKYSEEVSSDSSDIETYSNDSFTDNFEDTISKQTSAQSSSSSSPKKTTITDYHKKKLPAIKINKSQYKILHQNSNENSIKTENDYPDEKFGISFFLKVADGIPFEVEKKQTVVFSKSTQFIRNLQKVAIQINNSDTGKENAKMILSKTENSEDSEIEDEYEYEMYDSDEDDEMKLPDKNKKDEFSLPEYDDPHLSQLANVFNNAYNKFINSKNQTMKQSTLLKEVEKETGMQLQSMNDIPEEENTFYTFSNYKWKRRALEMKVKLIHSRIQPIKEKKISQLQQKREQIRIKCKKYFEDFSSPSPSSIINTCFSGCHSVKEFAERFTELFSEGVVKSKTVQNWITESKENSKACHTNYHKKMTLDSVLCLITTLLDFPFWTSTIRAQYLNSENGPNKNDPISPRLVRFYTKALKFTHKRAKLSIPARNYLGLCAARVVWSRIALDLSNQPDVTICFSD